ncbi:MAG: hypothetical protein ACI8U3_001286 [Brevundimonas sp.]|jgi:hypothetical protein|uniref:hypothetical protein n=1 Tax=Brevundimonas sp. TaxID=1871086 RepID=UPI0039E24D2E
MTVLCLYGRESHGHFEDLQHEMGLEECGGLGPAPGDFISASRAGASRTVWDVKARYFKPKGFGDYMALIVEKRDARPDEIDRF